VASWVCSECEVRRDAVRSGLAKYVRLDGAALFGESIGCLLLNSARTALSQGDTQRLTHGPETPHAFHGCALLSQPFVKMSLGANMHAARMSKALFHSQQSSSTIMVRAVRTMFGSFNREALFVGIARAGVGRE
jgi:hypothetical protein